MYSIVVVGLTGVEPVTLRLSSACSNQLSYKPTVADSPGPFGRRARLVELRRVELPTFCLQSRRSTTELQPHSRLALANPGHPNVTTQRTKNICPFKTELCDKRATWFAPGSTWKPVFNPVPSFLLRKEVIQPQVPLRLPCYDFIPITVHTFGV